MNKREINNIIINDYLDDFINSNEISKQDADNRHMVFEKFINNLALSLYGNDKDASYEDMETGSAIGIDGVAIFISDNIITNIDDIKPIVDSRRQIDISFIFTSTKTSSVYERKDIIDYVSSIERFFTEDKCTIPELSIYHEIYKEINKYQKNFKSQPKVKIVYACLSTSKIDMNDIHMKYAIDSSLDKLNKLNKFLPINKIHFIGENEIRIENQKQNQDLKKTITLTKQPIPYPKDKSNKIKDAYFGLIKIDQFIKLLVEDNDNDNDNDQTSIHKETINKNIFDDNIRYYLGSHKENDVNSAMKSQLLGDNKFLFGILNNGITIIADNITLSSEELTLVNYQIVNGCQTSNVLFEAIQESYLHENPKDDIYNVFIPIRFIATDDEETKISIIKANNSQTQPRSEQLAALLHLQKRIEEYYNVKNKQNKLNIYYERRTSQYRDEKYPRAQIITIHFQIKSTSALFFNIPHQVSGQYGKVEKITNGKLFGINHSSFLNSYYVSGLAWYVVERFLKNDQEGKKLKRSRWHIIMLLRYLCCTNNENFKDEINKTSESQSKQIEKILLDEIKINKILSEIIIFIKKCFNNEEEVLTERKLFERKDTTDKLIKFAQDYQKKNGLIQSNLEL